MSSTALPTLEYQPGWSHPVFAPRYWSLMAEGRRCWPHARFYREQKGIIQSVTENVETVVTAGNKLGKDYVAGWIAVMFFLHPKLFFPQEVVEAVERGRKDDRPDRLLHTRRVITTSVRADHLDVLWGEMGRWLTTSEVPLLEGEGGDLTLNSMELRFVEEREAKRPYNYCKGLVAGVTGEGLAGHHAEYTLCMMDEASGVPDRAYEMSQGWGKRWLIFGNPNPTVTFFKKMVEGGDIP